MLVSHYNDTSKLKLELYARLVKVDMIEIHPVTLEGHGVRLEPLTFEHREGLVAAASDGKLWELWFTSVPGAERR